jgi:tetratricopeptide (TPR) repeat protein
MSKRQPAPVRGSGQDPAPLIVAGLEAHRAGRLDEAEAFYAQALGVQPDHADALNLAGVLAFARGRTDVAIKLISRAVRAHPQHFDAYLNLAEALEKAGRQAEAIETCRKALVLKPDLADAHARLARLQADGGPIDLAMAHSRVALALDGDCVEALCAQGRVLRRLNRYAEADSAYRRALTQKPEDLNSLTGHAALLVDTDDPVGAADLYRRALTIAPEAAPLWAALGGVAERDGDVAAALEHFDRALAIDPRLIGAMFSRACCLRDTGDFSSAEEGFRRIVSAHPPYPPALLALARMKRLDGGPAEQKHLARLTGDPALSPRDRVQAGFALGELLEQAGDFDGAFRRFTDANTLYGKARAATGERFDRVELRTSVDLVGERLARDYARETAGWGVASEVPVFVVGLPRSGTTLIEQICASHSQVAGAGESRSIQIVAAAIATQNQGKDRLADWDGGHVRALSEKQVVELTRLGRGAERVIDKTPLNLMRLGLIGAMFPKARVIRCRRDGRDVAVSNHTMYFGQGNLYSTDQADCGYAVRQIERLGDYWQRESRLAILDVAYEDLVAELETQVRRIIDFLGLAWEPGCLAFQNTGRRVMTPSSWQVRQPIYSSSVGRWRRFERHLGPMLAALTADD